MNDQILALKMKKLAYGKICLKWICSNEIWVLKKKKKSGHSQTFLGIHSLAEIVIKSL